MQVKIMCQKDTSINNWVRDRKSRGLNYGASRLLDSEGTFQMPIFDFDLSSLKGKKVNKAWLVVRYQENPMMRYEISTITAPWEEGTGDGTNMPKYDGAVNERSGPDKKWGNGGRFPNFIFGNGNSTYCLGEPEVLEDQWQRMELDPSLIYERVYDRCFGFALVDARANMFHNEKVTPWEYKPWNKSVYSRESEYVPYLLVDVDENVQPEDMAIKSFKSLPFPYSLIFDQGQMLLEWELSRDIEEYVYFKLFCIDDSGEQEITTWETPKYKKGDRTYRAVLASLKPSSLYEVRLEVWGLTGKIGERRLKAFSTAAKERPAFNLPRMNNVLAGRSILEEGIYVLDENTKVNPVDGSIYFDDLDGKAYTLETIPSYIIDGKIVLKGVRNEFLDFQLIGKGMNFETKVRIERVALVNGESTLDQVDVYKIWYVPDKGKWYPEVTIPVDQDISKLVSQELVIDDQNYQGYYFEILVPENAEPGVYTGVVDIALDDKKVSLPLEIKVLPYVLSSTSDFVCDLNAYGPAYSSQGLGYDTKSVPNEEALKYEEAYYKTAHIHRTNYDPLSYTHMGNVYAGYIPEIEGEGENIRVKSWDAWDRRFEKYFNGEAFKDCPRKGVPIAYMYLPIHENWPSSLRKHYKVKVESTDYPELLNEHYSKATLPKYDFDEQHRIEIKQILKEFIRHIDEKGWKDVQFQYFFNNKHYYKDPSLTKNPDGISWWCLDEPFYRDDWYALQYFGEILREAREETGSGENVIFRADLSFAYIQFYYLDGLLDLSCSTTATYNGYPQQVRMREEQYGERFWLYGSANNPTLSNMNTYGTILMIYLSGAKGFVPWNNIGGYVDYGKPNPTAILYPAGKAGDYDPNTSLRLKTMRRVLQDIEYLRLVQEKYNYDAQQIHELVKGLLELKMREQKVDLEVTAQTHKERYFVDSLKIRELALSLL